VLREFSLALFEIVETTRVAVRANHLRGGDCFLRSSKMGKRQYACSNEAGGIREGEERDPNAQCVVACYPDGSVNDARVQFRGRRMHWHSFGSYFTTAAVEDRVHSKLNRTKAARQSGFIIFNVALLAFGVCDVTISSSSRCDQSMKPTAPHRFGVDFS